MSAFAEAAQEAVFSAIIAIAGGRVYDDAPDNVVFPYIAIGEGQQIDDDTGGSAGSGDNGVSEFFDLHIFSRITQDTGARGFKEVRQISDALHTALHGKALSITGRASALAWVRTVRMFREQDGLTRHGVVTVEIIHRT